MVLTEAEQANEELEEGLGTVLRVPLETGNLADEWSVEKHEDWIIQGRKNSKTNENSLDADN